MRKKYREYDEGRGLRAAGRRRGRRGGRVCGPEKPQGNEKNDEKGGRQRGAGDGDHRPRAEQPLSARTLRKTGPRQNAAALFGIMQW